MAPQTSGVKKKAALLPTSEWHMIVQEEHARLSCKSCKACPSCKNATPPSQQSLLHQRASTETSSRSLWLKAARKYDAIIKRRIEKQSTDCNMSAKTNAPLRKKKIPPADQAFHRSQKPVQNVLGCRVSRAKSLVQRSLFHSSCSQPNVRPPPTIPWLALRTLARSGLRLWGAGMTGSGPADGAAFGGGRCAPS